MRKRALSLVVVLFAAAISVSGGERPRPAPDWSTTATAWDSGDYEYDGAGNITRIGDDFYTYDALGRLTYATAKSPVSGDAFQRYEYDSYGNLKKVTTTTGGSDFVEAFRIDRNTNQLNGTDDCIAPYDVCFTGDYDGAGRQTGIIPNENRYEWTPLGELKGVNLSSRREQYIYDANGERIVTIDLDTGGRLFTLRNGASQVVREIRYDPSAQWAWNRDYVYRGDRLIAGFVAGEAGAGPHLHYHPDHLGTPRLITDAAGYKRTIHAYWPFGNDAPGSVRDPAERMKFTGHERDTSRDPNAIGHDLYYMHARFYTPLMGRFLSADPVIDFKTNLRSPQGWNGYSYVRDNPMRWTDPSGKVISYDEDFKHRLKTDAYFKAAFDAWKRSAAGNAQWKAMGKDTNTLYTFRVGMVKAMTAPLKEEQANGMTLPLALARNENKAGKLDMPNVSMTINADFITSTHSRVPEMTSRTMAKALFEEAQHGLDIGSATMSAKQAWDAEKRFHTDTEPRMKIFENQLNAILPPPDFH